MEQRQSSQIIDNEFQELYNDKKTSTPLKTIEEKWKLVPAFLRLRGLVKQHIDSFNHFLNIDIKMIVQANQLIKSDIDPTFYFKFTNITVGMPVQNENGEILNIMPNTCRIRNMSYSAPISVDVEYTRGNKIVIRNNVFIGKIPIMLGSSNCWLSGKSHEELAQIKECPYDPRGYFIVRGVERALLIQEQMVKNRIIIELDPKQNLCAQVTSSTYENTSRTTILQKKQKFYMKHNTFSDSIPIVIIFKAMGIECDQEFVQMVGSDQKYTDALALSLQECSQLNILTQNQALTYIASKFKSSKVQSAQSLQSNIEAIKDILKNLILHHIPLVQNQRGALMYMGKCRYIALMIRRIIDCMHDPSKLDDKDYYGNKRLELAGQLIKLLFDDTFKRFQFDLKLQIDKLLPKYTNKKEPFDALQQLRPDIISNSLESAITSGNWNLTRFKMKRAAVTQVLSRQSFIATLGMMTRISSQFEKTRKISGPRSLQPSQWGLLCPTDTPEGESCGLVKNLALTTHITTGSSEEQLLKISIDLGMEDASFLGGDELHSKNNCLIFLNGQIVGVHSQPQKFVQNLRLLRKRGRIQEFVSIFLNNDQNTIYIASDSGRLVRPLIVVENGCPKLKQSDIEDLKQNLKDFNDFLREGIIEYLDVNEENNALIALNEQFIIQDKNQQYQTTHMEIDPFTILGVVAGLIPYPNHNQSPRNTYQCAMGKQAIGTIGYNQFHRVDTLLYLMLYPQKPLVTSRTLDIINFECLPAGQNAQVAIMSYSGYDIEDAIILNKYSIDRGFARIMYVRRYESGLKRYPNGANDSVNSPPENMNSKLNTQKNSLAYKKFHALSKDGIAQVGENLNNGDIYINKYVPIIPESQINKENTGGRLMQCDLASLDYKPQPLVYKGINPTYVDRIILTTTPEEPIHIKMIARQTRVPEIGDKFSSRHGQKGVVGLVVPQEDMPFSERNGWCPDLIMNPHGFPSRMTVGKMIELLSGKAGVLEGKFKYGTAFAGDKVQDVGEILIKNGYSFDGKDVLMSGLTGELLPCYVFSGPIYYQRLKHMVQDKIHARSRGPKSNLTRQPTEGRARDGGLRLGEMERDCLIGYGAANLIQERLMLSSDQFQVYICQSCGFIGYENNCTYCSPNNQGICSIKMPYACKLLLQELQSMNIRTQIKLSDV